MLWTRITAGIHTVPQRRRIGERRRCWPIALPGRSRQTGIAPRVMPGATPSKTAVFWPNRCSSVTPTGRGRSRLHFSLREGGRAGRRRSPSGTRRRRPPAPGYGRRRSHSHHLHLHQDPHEQIGCRSEAPGQGVHGQPAPDRSGISPRVRRSRGRPVVDGRTETDGHNQPGAGASGVSPAGPERSRGGAPAP